MEDAFAGLIGGTEGADGDVKAELEEIKYSSPPVS